MEYIIISIAALIVSALTLFSGFGLGTLLMPVFALFFPIEIAVAATAIVHLANNLFKVILMGKYAKIQIVVLFAVPAGLAAIVGAHLLSHLMHMPVLFDYVFFERSFSVTAEKFVIALLILTFVVIELAPIQLSLISKKWLPVGGVLSGFFGGISGHQGALRTLFLKQMKLSKTELVGTICVSAIVVDVMRLSTYGLTFLKSDLLDLDHHNLIGVLIVGCISAFIGSYFGKRFLKKITLAWIQKIVSTMLIVMAFMLGFGII